MSDKAGASPQITSLLHRVLVICQRGMYDIDDMITVLMLRLGSVDKSILRYRARDSENIRRNVA